MWRDNWSINHGATVNYLKKVSLFSIPYIKKFPSKLKLEKTQNKNKIHIFFNFQIEKDFIIGAMQYNTKKPNVPLNPHTHTKINNNQN